MHQKRTLQALPTKNACYFDPTHTFILKASAASLIKMNTQKQPWEEKIKFVNRRNTKPSVRSVKVKAAALRLAGVTYSFLQYSCLIEKFWVNIYLFIFFKESSRKYLSLVFRRRVNSLLYRRHPADPLHHHSVISILMGLAAQRGREEDTIKELCLQKLFIYKNCKTGSDTAWSTPVSHLNRGIVL